MKWAGKWLNLTFWNSVVYTAIIWIPNTWNPNIWIFGHFFVWFSNGLITWLGRPFKNRTFLTIKQTCFVLFSDPCLKTRPFDNWTRLDHFIIQVFDLPPVVYFDQQTHAFAWSKMIKNIITSNWLPCFIISVKNRHSDNLKFEGLACIDRIPYFHQ